MQPNLRKRPAPGTSPVAQQAGQSTYLPSNYGDMTQLSNDQFLHWGEGEAGGVLSNSLQNTNLGSQYATTTEPNAMAAASGQLVRRNVNQQMTRAAANNPQGEFWQDQDESGSQNWDSLENDVELTARAAAAKRDALSKRPPKQIPPFIQKLSSFLDDGSNSNTDLIRWSERGDSFVVLDEARFAKQQLPNLFKHDNYASFVRQLNMYGFHKRVGLSDNSMRASENKSKTPSEYSNPYFRRGRPDLLWLIEKPRTAGPQRRKKGKSADGGQDSGDEALKEEASDAGGALSAGQGNELDRMPRAKLAALEQEVKDLQKSQQQIYSILARMRDENHEYIRQASAMVANHERHENSINAILTFLATFYDRTLQGQAGAGGMYANIPAGQPHGNVVDVGDLDDQSVGPSTPIPRQTRRPLLLPAPPVQSSESPVQGSPRVKEERFSEVRSAGQYRGSRDSSARSSRARTASPTTATANDIMSAINSANANSKSTSNQNIDINSALQRYQNANGKAPLTAEQRDNLLAMMASHSGTATPVISNNPAPFLHHLRSNEEQLQMLQRLQAEQDSRVQDLAHRIRPLSPSGRIPGLALPHFDEGNQDWNGALDQGDQSMFGNQPYNFGNDLDFNNYLNNDLFDFDNANSGAGDFHLDADLPTEGGAGGTSGGAVQEEGSDGENSLFGDDGDNPGGGRIVGSVETSSGAPTPKQVAVDVEEEPAMGNAKKKRRTGR